jgi:hypothetical protein
VEGDDLFDRARDEIHTLAGRYAPQGSRVAHVVTVCLLQMDGEHSAVITSNVGAEHESPEAMASTGLELLEHAERWIRENRHGLVEPTGEEDQADIAD